MYLHKRTGSSCRRFQGSRWCQTSRRMSVRPRYAQSVRKKQEQEKWYELYTMRDTQKSLAVLVRVVWYERKKNHVHCARGTHRNHRATFERCWVFVGRVRLGVWDVVLVVCVCVCRCRGCCSMSVCVCVCDLLIFLLRGALVVLSKSVSLLVWTSFTKREFTFGSTVGVKWVSKTVRVEICINDQTQ